MSKKDFIYNNSGGLSYGKNVIQSIIKLAAKEITGVAGLQGKELRYEINGSQINVDVFINIFYGHAVSDVAYRVQENIKRSVETMSGFRVERINVTVLGVTFSESAV